ncbi:MAG: response regulator transcription factor [Planctomycetes bacterium]|nr:response regulator transcription factor [Planctomycetota bacterium]
MTLDNVTRYTLLIIEDEPDIQEMLSFNLRQEGFRVFTSSSGEDGLDMVRRKRPHLVLLDLMLPGMNGMDVCRQIRKDSDLDDTRILMLTAKSEEADVVSGMELGADDYVTKPFSNRVLLARIRTLLRRCGESKNSDEEVIKIGSLIIHPGRREVMVGDERVELTSSEFKALHLLARRPGWVFSRWQIVDSLHGPGYAVTERAIDVLMVSLRKKLGSAAKMIATIRGAGYRFNE